MAYKYIGEENLGDIGLCIDEVTGDPAVIPVFVVSSKEMADRITSVAKKSDEKKWAVAIVQLK